jgi:protocatechuate 4,5-dioxygenase alpha subunit
MTSIPSRRSRSLALRDILKPNERVWNQSDGRFGNVSETDPKSGDAPPLSDWGIPGTYIFDASRSRIGYALNKLAYSLTDKQNRDRFRADEESYMAKYNLTEDQRQAIRDRDWLRLMKECGGNVYYIYKIGAAVGDGLYHMGAQMRGQSFEEFLESRNAKGAR